jgi:hypothetical protein
MERKGKNSKGKAGGGDRYDVMLSGGGDQMKMFYSRPGTTSLRRT